MYCMKKNKEDDLETISLQHEHEPVSLELFFFILSSHENKSE